MDYLLTASCWRVHAAWRLLKEPSEESFERYIWVDSRDADSGTDSARIHIQTVLHALVLLFILPSGHALFQPKLIASFTASHIIWARLFVLQFDLNC